MSYEFSGQSETQHPMWEGAVSGMVTAIGWGLIAREDAPLTVKNVCISLRQEGWLDNLGELQRYLRKRQAIVQLFAKQFNPGEIHGTSCLDVVTGEPKEYYLMITFGTQDIEARRNTLGLSHEVNETTLARQTGVLMLGDKLF